MRLLNFLLVAGLLCMASLTFAQRRALVFQSDFGVKDGAVGAMKGVAFAVSDDLRIFDLTHEIPAYNIWEAAYRLNQAAPYWPKGTVFVSIVDPGVGSDRKSVVLKTQSGHYVVTPDNGTLTLVAEALGIQEMREIDEAKNRLKNSNQSYTFHGRDVYAYTGARLAAGIITFEEVGPKLKNEVVRIAYQKPVVENNEIRGNIPVLDIQYGNVWTNIDGPTLARLNIQKGDKVAVKIYHNQTLAYEGTAPLVNTFSGVKEGEPLAYMNSLLNFSLGINMGDFATQHKVSSGPEWTIVLKKG
ncbi:SAM hydrolase/SAM-dependent halogenase family protein [Chryseolinea lacunae]|uniref:S-adenosyl-l-methionine hydroxide adenosyltransferase family protein n=1 Tax=Chryseolinea lacunae TaxID=2801331 RepID=A0ABS1KXB6_9BACT|nr:S-adenosyl-l-methionine hydroxide adenosyltransferase family protein [Chryseolinea lacunae]MBL0743848.1 S-adenosyl-l-methionine hydroxide adenosyltransferase family protein [Chryseolinea lacunae]